MVDSDRIKNAVTELLTAIGEDPKRSELLATPEKFAEAYQEFFRGVGVDPLTILADAFPAEQNDVVILKDIELVSICEHHLLPFTGVAHIAYLPNGKIVGLGRLAQLVDVLAARPQLQENLTSQIAQAIETGLKAQGVIVVIEAHQHCVASRGVRQQNSNTVTMRALGTFSEPVARAEIMALIAK